MVKEEILERIYTIPLRKEWLKAPRYKRAKKAIKAIREFLAKHMKIPNRDTKKIKIDPWVNKAIWLRGIRKPPHKITVKAIKDSENNVRVEFVGLPKKFKVEEQILKKKMEKAKIMEAKLMEKKKEKEKKEEEKEEKKEKKEEKEREEKEKILHKEIETKKEKIVTKPTKEKKEMRRMALEK